ncbi:MULTISPECIES: AmmeMemoRadiSam system protein B [unclassified Kosmotoga]|jgi:hypothetical protein|uniref:AmmeMemoRadiSam system protein B n=1 Tax=unclassified Kosmotoga TaxID=2631489 RepID=UPI0007C49543|nr:MULTISPECIES: AmmeMemoRadiSam system protein B [unclassified Kosmotoga]MDI3523328.1 hypothetical protein [Kosmotoga sp.]MDK2953550.1 hypothetical protein [Kosmotoga sp.]OAA19409.1 dioxygenase [Kosmotoga sp. DU53]
MDRKPVFAGRFYASNAEELKKQITACYDHPVGPGELPGPVFSFALKNAGLITPHAGYMYSGPVAAHGYLELSKIGKPRKIIIIGPNHTGYGARLSIWPEGSWHTSLGTLRIDESLVGELIRNSQGELKPDTSAHLYEHSIEVQLPFIQHIFDNDPTIVPIIMTDQSINAVKTLVESIAAILKTNEGILVIASSDMNHYDNHETTLRKDELLIKALLTKDIDRIYQVARENRITACGLGPIAVVLNLFDELKILKHATSGEVSGDKYHTVGYLSAILS